MEELELKRKIIQEKESRLRAELAKLEKEKEEIQRLKLKREKINALERSRSPGSSMGFSIPPKRGGQ